MKTKQFRTAFNLSSVTQFGNGGGNSITFTASRTHYEKDDNYKKIADGVISIVLNDSELNLDFGTYIVEFKKVD